LISDTHNGKLTDTYNSEVLKDKFDGLYKQIKDTTRTYKDIDDIHVVLLGDIIDGEGIYPTQSYECEYDVDTSEDSSIAIFRDFYDRLGNEYNHIYTHAVYGNHGRTGKYNSPTNNYDLKFYKRLGDNYHKDNSYIFDIKQKWYGYYSIYDHNILIHHGNKIKMYQNIPLYGIINKHMRWMLGGISETYSAMFVGHFHSLHAMEWNGVMIQLNGTPVTSDPFCEELGLVSSNKFCLITHTSDSVINSIHYLNM
jgi:hypothetical protein